MSRVCLTLVLTLATVTVAVLVRAPARSDPQSAAKSSPSSTAPQPLILQEGDGDHLIRSGGPLSGLPFTIKLDGQNGNTQDFFVFTSALSPGETIRFHNHDNPQELLIS